MASLFRCFAPLAKFIIIFMANVPRLVVFLAQKSNFLLMNVK